MTKKKQTMTFFDFKQMCMDAQDMFEKHSKELVNMNMDALMDIMEILADEKRSIKDAQKKFLGFITDEKKLLDDGEEKWMEFFSKSIYEAYEIGYREGSHSSEQQFVTEVGKLLDEERLSDPFGSLARFLEIVKKVSDETFEESMKGKAMHLLFPEDGENARQDNENNVE